MSMRVVSKETLDFIEYEGGPESAYINNKNNKYTKIRTFFSIL